MGYYVLLIALKKNFNTSMHSDMFESIRFKLDMMMIDTIELSVVILV